MVVGDIFETKNYGSIEILSYVNCSNIEVKFINTGYVKKTNSSQIKNGILKDNSVRIYGIQIGDEFKTNYSGDCVVVDYIHAKKIQVRFKDSGKLKWTNSSQLVMGTASDRDEFVKVKVGDYYKNNEGYSARVIEILKGSRFTVEFEDGHKKNINITMLKAGTFLKGSCAYTQEEAINAMKEVHGDRYDYSLVEFKGVKDKIAVRCTKHGIFNISFDNHVNSANGGEPSGCRECGIEARSRKKTLDSNLFVEAAKALNGDKYEYHLADYTTRDKKIPITCNCCGSTFKQSPEKHLGGNGCPSCAKTGFDPSKKGVVYVLRCGNVTKVGITNKAASSRAKDISASYGGKFEVFKEFPLDGKLCVAVERAALTYLKQNYDRPSIKFNGYSECFLNLKPDDLVEMLECLI